MSSKHAATPIGGPLLTNTFKVAAVLAIAAALIILWRFNAGLGATTAMNDVLPWGVWKLFNVIVLTSVASGGYAIALLVYVINKGKYHSLVRHALLTSAVGYTAAVLALGIDVGKPWNFWKVPTWTWAWNTDSVLLEVALCISAYILVLWAEMSPAFLEHWANRKDSRFGALAGRLLPRVDASLIWIIGLGILLPTMHQSSLGSLYILAGTKVHVFWRTPYLPLLFLISCWIMGYAAVIITYITSSTRYRRETEFGTLVSLGRVMGWVMIAFMALRTWDLVHRGQLPAILAGDPHNWMLLAEFGLLGLGAWRVFRPSSSLGTLYRTGMSVLLGAALYRIGVVWVGFHPLGGGTYFPSLPELMVTLGFIAVQVMGYLLIVKRFPILDARTRRRQPREMPVPMASTVEKATG